MLVILGFAALNAVMILGIAREAERFPDTDAGMAAMSLAFIDIGFLVFFAIAAGSRLKRWLWRRSHV